MCVTFQMTKCVSIQVNVLSEEFSQELIEVSGVV